jgi:hypothetical protein
MLARFIQYGIYYAAFHKTHVLQQILWNSHNINFTQMGRKRQKFGEIFHLLSQGMHEFSLKSNGTQHNSVEIWDTEFYPN